MKSAFFLSIFVTHVLMFSPANFAAMVANLKAFQENGLFTDVTVVAKDGREFLLPRRGSCCI